MQRQLCQENERLKETIRLLRKELRERPRTRTIVLSEARAFAASDECPNNCDDTNNDDHVQDNDEDDDKNNDTSIRMPESNSTNRMNQQLTFHQPPIVHQDDSDDGDANANDFRNTSPSQINSSLLSGCDNQKQHQEREQYIIQQGLKHRKSPQRQGSTRTTPNDATTFATHSFVSTTLSHQQGTTRSPKKKKNHYPTVARRPPHHHQRIVKSLEESVSLLQGIGLMQPEQRQIKDAEDNEDELVDLEDNQQLFLLSNQQRGTVVHKNPNFPTTAGTTTSIFHCPNDHTEDLGHDENQQPTYHHHHHQQPPPPDHHSLLLFVHSVKERAVWLIGLLLLQSLSSFIIRYHETLLQHHIIIVQFLTMLVGAGGNGGNQASVRIIRGLALGTIHTGNLRNTILQEIAMGFCLSILLGCAGAIRAILFAVPIMETLAITVSLVCIVFWSVVLGAILPLLMRYIGIDPAHSSTTIQVLMDILGVTITVYVSGILLDSTLGQWIARSLGGEQQYY